MSSILDALHAHMGGGDAPAPPDAAGPPPGLPPELMAALGHGAAPDGPDAEQAGEQNEVELLSKIIDDIHAFLKVAADEDDKATVAACLAQLQKLRAKDQAEMDGASQGKLTPRMVRKTAAVQGGGFGG